MSNTAPQGFSLQHKVALVTGSTKGIGRATAEVLAAAGAHVIISSRKPEACEEVAQAFAARGLSAEAKACNIGHQDQIAEMESWLEEKHGGIDILVNNAVLSPVRTIAETDLSIFRKSVEVNLEGHWYISAAAARLMDRRGGGAIVNVASVAAMHPDRGLALYSTLKTALIGMSRSFAMEYGAKGIRVNTILPGLIETDLAAKYDDAETATVRGRTAIGRLGRPEEVGQAILFLVAPASSYVTGANLVIDGGLSIGLF